MSHWCKDHPRYEGQNRKPGSGCKRCWELYFLRNPEEKQEVMDTYEELAKMKEKFHV